MAKVDGKCANCASIFLFDDKEEKARCPFCWAETPRDEALALYKDDEGHVYKNESFEQPSEEERCSLVRSRGTGPSVSAKKKTQVQEKKRKSNEPSAVERVKAMSRPIVRVPRVPLKSWLLVGGVTCALLILFLAVSLPLYFSRRAHHASMSTKVEKLLSSEIEQKDFAIDGHKNEQLLLILPDDLDAAKAESLAISFRKIHEEEYGEAADTARVRVRVLGTKHAYEVLLRGEEKKVLELEDQKPLLSAAAASEAESRNGTGTNEETSSSGTSAESQTGTR